MSAPKLHLVTSAHDLPEDKRQRTAQHKLNLPITPTAYWLVILTSLLCLSDVVPLHVPVVDGLGENRPTQRKQIIYDQLQHHSQHLTTHLLRTPLPHPPSLQLASCVHTPDYLSFLERAWSEWSAHVASRTHDTYMTSQMTRAGGDASVFLPGQIAARDGSSVVTAGRVDGGVLAGLSRPGGSIHSQICYYALDRLTPIQAHTLTDLANDLRVIQTAASLIPPPLSPLTPPAEPVYVYALTTQPGHHAHTSAFGGYCYVATAAVCAALLREKGYGRVGVLDVDYHAGNGTVQIFYGTSEVFVATLHADPDIDYPYNNGYADQTGAGSGTGYTLNIPLPQHTTWQQYKQHLTTAINRLLAAHCTALVVSVGVDTVKGDPECSALGGFALCGDEYREMGRMIRAMGLPTVYVQEGGYKLDEVGVLVRNIVLPDFD